MSGIAGHQCEPVMPCCRGEHAIDRGERLIESDSTPALADLDCDRKDSFLESPFEAFEPSVERTPRNLVAPPDQLDAVSDLWNLPETLNLTPFTVLAIQVAIAAIAMGAAILVRAKGRRAK